MMSPTPDIELKLLQWEDWLSRGGPAGVTVLDAGEKIPEPERRLQFYCTHGVESIKQFLTYEEDPVGVREFVESKQYLDRKGVLWPVVMDELEELCCGKYDVAVLTGAIGTAKTTVAVYAVAYMVYQISVIRNPHKMFDLIDTDEIVIVFQSLRKSQAEEVGFTRFKNLVDTAPYFNGRFCRNKELSSEAKFPKRLVVKPLSGSVTAAIGNNVIGGFVDEVNFMAVIENSKQSVGSDDTFDQAKAIYRAIMRRRESRFLRPGTSGQLPGILCLGSSKQYPGEFTETIIKQAEAEKARAGYTHTFVYDKRRWDVKPEDYRDGKWFNVFIGDETRRPRILQDGEDVSVEDESLVMEIPEDHRRAFEDDLLNALRDVAGVSTQALHPFIPNTEKIAVVFGKVTSVLTAEWCDFKDAKIGLDVDQISRPAEPRFIHVDLGKTKDSAGVACCYVDKFVEIQRSETEVETWPLVRFDFVLEVRPPKNNEIPYDKIRSLIYALRENGMNVRWASLDTYQSVDFLQLVRQRGIATVPQSVDTDLRPYTFLKTAIYDGRVHAPAHQRAQAELSRLEWNIVKNIVDHPPSFSKDVADAMAGALFGLTMRLEVWSRHKVRPLLPKRLLEQAQKIEKRETRLNSMKDDV